MKIYPPTYKPSVAAEPAVLSVEQATWAEAKIRGHMSEDKGYRVRELVLFLHDEMAVEYPNEHFKKEVLRDLILQVDKDWGWHPVIEAEELIK